MYKKTGVDALRTTKTKKKKKRKFKLEGGNLLTSSEVGQNTKLGVECIIKKYKVMLCTYMVI